jgi:Uma2 family endonuclease
MSAETIDYSWMHEQISAEQYDAMPEELCRNIEIVDGMVHMSPAASSCSYHNDLMRAIANGLEAACGPSWRVTCVADLRLRDIPLQNRQPDVLVYDTETPRRRPPIPASAALVAVEIVSPGSQSTDRIVKPLEYAAAGIRFFWRVEIDGDVPVVYTYALDGTTGTYRGTGVFDGVVKTDVGFPVEIDLTDV